MGRYKPNVSEIQNLEDADRLLKEMCALETQIERIDADGDKPGRTPVDRNEPQGVPAVGEAAKPGR